MPIFEYKCNACGEEFELLIMGKKKAACTKCGSKGVTKKFSVFGMSGVEKPFAGTSSGCTSCSKPSCSSC
jgi:putative FmdB family regulatory protein